MRIGLFGGTFDPIHEAHLAVARAARDRYNLDRVLLIPAAVPPHKHGRTAEPWIHRLAMTQIACAGETGLEASALESGSEPSYSIDTVDRVAAELGHSDKMFFIIGADAFAEIRTWHRWTDVIRAVDFIVVTRPGHSYSCPEGARVHPLEDVHLPVSSSSIREELACGQTPPELPREVLEYIRHYKLYGFGSARGLHPDLPLTPDPISH